MNRSGAGILAVAVFVAVFAGSGRTPNLQRAAQAVNNANSGGTHRSPNSSTDLGNKPDGFADQATLAANVIKKATTAGLSADEANKLDAELRAQLEKQPMDPRDACWPKEVTLPASPAKATARPCWPRQDVHFMIALLPDPVRTHLALSFDRILDALQQAIEDSHFDLDRALLPWDPQGHIESDDYAKRAAEAQYVRDKERVPGVLIYRSYYPDTATQTLLVFVVSDRPTAGIHRGQFSAALQMARVFSSQKNLLIMGPSFSGSLYSLAEVLKTEEARRFATVTIASGDITSDDAVTWFKSELERMECSEAAPKPLNFASFPESGNQQQQAILKYAEEKWGLKSHEIASLSETETTFGRQADNKDLVSLYFPPLLSG